MAISVGRAFAQPGETRAALLPIRGVRLLEAEEPGAEDISCGELLAEP
jgi:hypothetical protein